MKLRATIKKKIKELGSVNAYADEHNIRRASLTDYLNGKKDLTTKVLFRVLEPLGMNINSINSGFLSKVDKLEVNGKIFKKGSKYNGIEVISCWENKETEAKAIVQKINDTDLQLRFL